MTSRMFRLFLLKHAAGAFGELRAPCIALSCKTDLPQRVNPKDAHSILQQYQVGLIEVSTVTDQSKERIRKAFEFILTAIFRDLGNFDCLNLSYYRANFLQTGLICREIRLRPPGCFPNHPHRGTSPARLLPRPRRRPRRTPPSSPPFQADR